MLKRYLPFLNKDAEAEGKGRGLTKLSKPSKPRKTKPAVTTEGFWHQPALMNVVADTFIVAASVALAYAAVVAVQRLPFYPLREVVITSKLDQVQRAEIETAARETVTGNFFTVNIDAARVAFEKLPWVRRVDIRRTWPDGLELAIEEHVPVAKWRSAEGEPRMVNSYGEVFAGNADMPLPVFSGPEGTSAQVLARFKEFDKALSSVGRHPKAVALSAREAWQVRLDNGVLIDLGRDQTKLPLNERLARFTQYYRQAVNRSQINVAVVDMRYPNGFSLRAAGSDKTTAGNT